MENSTVARLCKFCNQPIGRMRGPLASYCTKACAAEASTARQRGKIGTSPAKTASRDPIVHSCLASPFNRFDPKACHCRLRLSDDEMHRLFREGGAVNFDPTNRESRHWDRGDAILIGLIKQTPRASTIDAVHIDIATDFVASTSGEASQQLRADYLELKRRIQADRVLRSEEELARWDIYAELSRDFFKSLTVEVPEAEWQTGEQENRGTPAYLRFASESRTSGGFSETSTTPSADEPDRLSEEIAGSDEPASDSESGDHDETFYEEKFEQAA